MEQGKIERFRRVYDAVFPVILRITYRITGDETTAEEVCQESFIKYLDRIDSIPDEEQARFWLIRVAKNLALNIAKRKTRERTAYERFAAETRHDDDPADTELLRQSEVERVQRLLQRLPENLRTVLVMKEYGGLNYREIGSILRLTEGNVKVRVHRARARLAKLLEEEEA